MGKDMVEAQRRERKVCMRKVSCCYPRPAGKRLVRTECELHSPALQQLPLRSLSAVCLTHNCPDGAAEWPIAEDIAPAANASACMNAKCCRESAYILVDFCWMK